MYVDIVISNIFNLNKHSFFLFFFLRLYLTSALRFLVLAALSQFIPTASCNGIPHQSIWSQSERTQGQTKQKWQRETHSVTYVPGLSTLSDLSRIDAQPPPSFLCCPRPPSHHTSSQLRSPSYPSPIDFGHQHPSGHTVLIHSFHMPNHLKTIWSALLANSLSINNPLSLVNR